MRPFLSSFRHFQASGQCRDCVPTFYGLRASHRFLLLLRVRIHIVPRSTSSPIGGVPEVARPFQLVIVHPECGCKGSSPGDPHSILRTSCYHSSNSSPIRRGSGSDPVPISTACVSCDSVHGRFGSLDCHNFRRSFAGHPAHFCFTSSTNPVPSSAVFILPLHRQQP